MDIREFPEDVVVALAWPLDFDIKNVPTDPIWFSSSPALDFVPLAGEGTGGVYAQVQDNGPVLFVDSEGAGGVIAPDVESLLLILVCHPYWRDLLKFSGGGKLSEMRRALPFVATEYFEDMPEASSHCLMIRQRLHLPTATDVVDVLHSSVASSSKHLTLYTPDGLPLRSLFSDFTIDRNPAWRKASQS